MLLMIPVGFCYSELASMLPYAGGSYNYIGHAFGQNTAFYFSWSQTISYFAVTAFNILATVTILQYAGVIPTSYPVLVEVALAFGLFYTILNWFKVELSAMVQFGLFWLLFITGMIWNGGALFFYKGWSFSYFHNFIPYGTVGFLVAAGVMVTMYFGFEIVANMSEEANYPAKRTWIPVIGAIAIAGLVYVFTLFAMAGVAPLSYLINTPEVPGQIVFLTEGHSVLGYIGWTGIVLGGIACALTTVDGFWLALSRLWYALGRSNMFPKQIGQLNRYQVPGIATVLIFIGLVPLIVFSTTLWIALLFVLMGITIAVVYVGTTLSFIQLRRKHPEWKRPYKAPGGYVMGILGLIGAGFCVFWSADALIPVSVGGEYAGGWQGWYLLIGYFIAGIIVAYYMAYYRRRRNLKAELCKEPECEPEKIEHKTLPMKSG
jgi:APA family basic amino acid/polyamine antiporter